MISKQNKSLNVIDSFKFRFYKLKKKIIFNVGVANVKHLSVF